MLTRRCGPLPLSQRTPPLGIRQNKSLQPELESQQAKGADLQSQQALASLWWPTPRDWTGALLGFIWVDNPSDRLVPSADRLQALRIFANDAAAARYTRSLARPAMGPSRRMTCLEAARHRPSPPRHLLARCSNCPLTACCGRPSASLLPSCLIQTVPMAASSAGQRMTANYVDRVLVPGAAA